MTSTTDGNATAQRDRIVLGFAGDLETTVAVHWLAETCSADVIAMIADFGQSRDLEGIRDRALALGALRAHVLDVREEFARACLLPALRAGVLGGASRRLPAALGHAVVAGKLVEIAGIEQANRVAHGGVTSAPRIAAAVHSLKPDFRVLAPACEWGMSRDALLEYAAKRQLRLTVDAAGAATGPHAPGVFPPSLRDGAARRREDRELGESVEQAHPASLHDGRNDKSPGGAPLHAGEPAVVDIAFQNGIPVALNGVNMPLPDLIGSLDFLAGKNGVGRREPFETPAVTVLATAHEELRSGVDTGELADFSRTVACQYAELVEEGRWFSVLRGALDAYVDRAEQVVNGVVRVKLFQGACDVAESHVADTRENDDNAVVGALRYRA